MPTTLAKIDIVNMALSQIGVSPLTDLEDADSVSTAQANINWQLAVASMGRMHAWNCLMKPAQLQPEAQDPIEPAASVPASTAWAPATAYAVNAYVTFGDPAYLYQCLVANTSSASFINDLTQGFWFQTDTYNSNPFGNCLANNYVSGWAYKYTLPEDLLLLCSYNDRPIEEVEEQYEIMGSDLYTNETTAFIKYTWANPDTTRYDAMFVDCLVTKLAGMLATMLRQDDRGIAQAMEGLFLKKLAGARTKDANERRARRFNPVANSRIVGSRYFSTNS